MERGERDVSNGSVRSVGIVLVGFLQAGLRVRFALGQEPSFGLRPGLVLRESLLFMETLGLCMVPSEAPLTIFVFVGGVTLLHSGAAVAFPVPRPPGGLSLWVGVAVFP